MQKWLAAIAKPALPRIGHRAMHPWLILGIPLLLSNCALLRGHPPAVTFVNAAERQIRFASGFEHPRIQSVAYRDPSEYEEYDRVTGDARAEIILSVANGPQTALEFPAYRLRPLSKSWSFNQNGAQLDWGTTRYLNADGRSFTYVLYKRQAASGLRTCMAFLRRWASPPDDPMHRPGKALFGYYCAPAGKRMSDDGAVAVLRGIVISERRIPPVYYGQTLPRDPGALEAARGGADSTAGNPQFPFNFSRYYNVGDGDNTLH